MEKPDFKFKHFRNKIQDCKIGIANACFYPEYSEKLKKGAMSILHEAGILNVLELEVPGSWEIPLGIEFLIDHKKCNAIIVLGVLIRGETSHYDLICNSVERRCSEIQAKYTVPISFGLLTAENKEQVIKRCGGTKGNRGEEAAKALIHLYQSINNLME